MAKWLSASQKLWAKHRSGRATFKQQIDHYGKLSGQFPIAALRVIFSKAGTLPAACVLRDQTGIIDHKLYWARIGTEAEAFYLTAILNTEAVRIRIAHLQVRGEQGARDFDKLMFTLPIPLFDAADPVHGELAKSGQAAEAIVTAVAIPKGASLQRARRLVRAALMDDGVTARIDALVEALLGPNPLRDGDLDPPEAETEDADAETADA